MPAYNTNQPLCVSAATVSLHLSRARSTFIFQMVLRHHSLPVRPHQPSTTKQSTVHTDDRTRLKVKRPQAHVGSPLLIIPSWQLKGPVEILYFLSAIVVLARQPSYGVYAMAKQVISYLTEAAYVRCLVLRSFTRPNLHASSYSARPLSCTSTQYSE